MKRVLLRSNEKDVGEIVREVVCEDKDVLNVVEDLYIESNSKEKLWEFDEGDMIDCCVDREEVLRLFDCSDIECWIEVREVL